MDLAPARGKAEDDGLAPASAHAAPAHAPGCEMGSVGFDLSGEGAFGFADVGDANPEHRAATVDGVAVQAREAGRGGGCDVRAGQVRQLVGLGSGQA